MGTHQHCHSLHLPRNHHQYHSHLSWLFWSEFLPWRRAHQPCCLHSCKGLEPMVHLIKENVLWNNEKPITCIVLEQKDSNLYKLEIKPRLLKLQANTLTCHCKSRLLPQGRRSILYTYTLWHSLPPIWNLSVNFLVQESYEMRPRVLREIFMHRTDIGWVIYGGRHCCGAKRSKPVPARNWTRVAGSTGKHSTMSL